jgi:hypothetical protein
MQTMLSTMIGRLAVVAVALATLAGCGSAEHRQSHSEPKSKLPSPLGRQLSGWSSAATSYNSILQGCRQPYPTHGYVAACTRQWRLDYVRATSRLRRALRSERPSSTTCRKAFLQAESLVIQTTTALRQAFDQYSALLDKRPYRGTRVRPSSVGIALGRADRISKRNTKLADRLSAALRRRCSA